MWRKIDQRRTSPWRQSRRSLDHKLLSLQETSICHMHYIHKYVQLRMIAKLEELRSSLDHTNDDVGDLHTRGVVEGWDASLGGIPSHAWPMMLCFQFRR